MRTSNSQTMPVRRTGRSVRRTGGAVAVEFALILTGSLALFAPAGEFYRLSLIDQTLARATHQAARAAATAGPDNCRQAIGDAFQEDRAARWLLDRNDDGTVGIVQGGEDWPDGSAGGEVQITVFGDSDLTDGVPFAAVDTGCGADGGWIAVRARIVVWPWFGPLRAAWPDGIRRQHESWARNQAG